MRKHDCDDSAVRRAGLLPPPFVWLSRRTSSMEESSSKNAAMVLKITETSQGNVCPVDICLDLDDLPKPYNDLRWSSYQQYGRRRTVNSTDLLENSHVYPCKARADKGPNAVIARWSSTKSCRPTVETCSEVTRSICASISSSEVRLP